MKHLIDLLTLLTTQKFDLYLSLSCCLSACCGNKFNTVDLLTLLRGPSSLARELFKHVICMHVFSPHDQASSDNKLALQTKVKKKKMAWPTLLAYGVPCMCVKCEDSRAHIKDTFDIQLSVPTPLHVDPKSTLTVTCHCRALSMTVSVPMVLGPAGIT